MPLIRIRLRERTRAALLRAVQRVDRWSDRRRYAGIMLQPDGRLVELAVRRTAWGEVAGEVERLGRVPDAPAPSALTIKTLIEARRLRTATNEARKT